MAINSLARFSIHFVAVVSAGPPLEVEVVLEAAVFRRIVPGRDDDAVGLRPSGISGVVGEDGVRECRRRCVAEVQIDHYGDVVGGEHFEGGGEEQAPERACVSCARKRGPVVHCVWR